MVTDPRGQIAGLATPGGGQTNQHRWRTLMMKRRDISTLLLAGAAGSAIAPKSAQAATCTQPCYPRTAAEMAAGVTPLNTSYPPGHVLRYGMVEGKNIDTNVNTLIFTSMMSVAAANKGMEVYFPVG